MQFNPAEQRVRREDIVAPISSDDWAYRTTNIGHHRRQGSYSRVHVPKSYIHANEAHSGLSGTLDHIYEF